MWPPSALRSSRRAPDSTRRAPPSSRRAARSSGSAAGASQSARSTVAGVTFTKDALAKKVEAALGLYTREAEASFHRLRRARDEEADGTAEFVADMLVTVQNQHGRDSEKLEEFGFRPRKKPAERSAEEKAAQVARTLQTKEKNGTIRPRSNQAHPA